jgi:hypothetical protein
VVYLLVALVVAVVGILVVLLRQRTPRSIEASIEEFARARSAISPEAVTRVAPPPDAVRADQRALARRRGVPARRD